MDALELERRKVDHLRALYEAQTERRVQLELLLEDCREHVAERAFGINPSPEALRVLRDIGDAIGRRR